MTLFMLIIAKKVKNIKKRFLYATNRFCNSNVSFSEKSYNALNLDNDRMCKKTVGFVNKKSCKYAILIKMMRFPVISMDFFI